MKLILVAPNPALTAAFREHFHYLPDVEIINNSFEAVSEYDCLVSPANSFGLMDGGIDAAIIDYFGKELMMRVQDKILTEYLGEQPVGTCLIVETQHPKHPFLAHTPTMRVPMSITGTDIPYTAMWAMLLEIRRHNLHHKRKIESVLCPGLGTGIGKVPYSEAARQMALAYDHFVYPPTSINTFFAAERQLQIWEGGKHHKI
ncbi:MAG: macro domain-containing protein [Lyngbya sp.]|nr:macro domain-containing protein [Lyngbya sp.]